METVVVLCLVLCTVLVITIITISVFIFVRVNKLMTWTNRQIEIIHNHCQEYAKYACNHSNETYSKNAEGNHAVEGMLPHMAFIKLKYRSGNTGECDGTLISEYFVMTAARCVQHLNQDQIMIKLGSVFNTNDTTGEWFNVDEIHVHSEYSDLAVFNDIALLKLDKKVDFSCQLRPICLDTNLDLDGVPTFSNVTLSGWDLDQSGPAPERLQILDTYLGETILSACRRDWNIHFNSEIICAGHGILRKSKCRIDLGGPLQMPLAKEYPNTYVQLGIAVSSEPECQKNVKNILIVTYAKVERFIPWIASIVWPQKQSKKFNFFWPEQRLKKFSVGVF